MYTEEEKLEVVIGKYSRILLTFFVVLLFFSLAKTSLAASVLRGAAWWGSDLEFLYFNCNDYESGSRLDNPNNFADLPDPPGFKFFIGGCVINHAVQIDSNGLFSGSGYNFKKGVINFGGTTAPVVLTPAQYSSFASNCLSPCTAANNCSACYNANNQRIYGYAQVASGSKELIRLDSSGVSENKLQLKSWNLASSTDPFYSNLNPGDFMGHASSTISINGVSTRVPLSFNCLSEYGVSSGFDSCAERDYKVYIGNPEVGKMTAPNWSYENACSPGKAKTAVLRWYLKGGSYQGYEVAVTKNDVLATSTVNSNVVCYSDIQSGSANQYTIPNSNDKKCKLYSDLEYGFSYYWFVRLHYLVNGVLTPTEWYQFGGDTNHQGTLFDENNGPPNTYIPADNKKTFTTYKHEFPVPYFTWDPEEIKVGSTTIFNALTPSPNPTPKSRYYTTGSPLVPLDCSSGSCDFFWTTNASLAVIGNPNNSTSTIVFNQPGDATVSLTVTDNESYQCTKSIIITKINYELPVWKEVKAE